MTEPLAPKVLKVLKFDSPSGAEGCGIAFGDEYKDGVTRFPAGHSHSEPPQPILIRLRRTVPLCRGQNIPLYIYLQSHVIPLPSAHSPTALAGGRWWRQPPKGGAAGMVLADSDISVACQSPESAADAATPYPASPDFPLFRGQNIPLYVQRLSS